MLKWLLGLLKPIVQNVVDSLEANKASNIASIEDAANAEGATVATATTNFIATEAEKEAFLAPFVPTFKPLLETELNNLVAAGTANVPALYDAAITFLEKEEGDL